MADQQLNPFASPKSEPSAPAGELPELQGRMPGSVVTAMCCGGILAAINLLFLAGVLFSGGADAVLLLFLVGPLTINVLVLAGLWRRNRLARQWGRIMGLLGAVLTSLVAASMAIGYFHMYYSGVGVFDPSLNDPGIDAGWFLASMLIGLAFYILPAVLLWTGFFALGRATAKQWFRLICPSCGFERVKAVDFVYRRAKCKRCGEVW